MERFLARLAQSPHRDKFVLKGGSLLAKYLPIGRETYDLDFFVQKLSNTEQVLKKSLQEICDINPNDSFEFSISKVKTLNHVHLAYTGAEISLLAQFGATRTVIRIDLGFGDRVEPIDHPIDLTTTPKGPLFESKISLRCYPKKFIFAEKLETVVFRGESNTRMKDFHDLYSLISLGNLDRHLTEKAIQLVFHHRGTSLTKIPIIFSQSTLEILDKNWNRYRRKRKAQNLPPQMPEFMEDLVSILNQWLKKELSSHEPKTNSPTVVSP